MATWGRFGASLRNFFRTSWTLGGKVPLKPVVGGAVLGCLVAGGFLRYHHDPRWRAFQPTVIAKETAVGANFPSVIRTNYLFTPLPSV